MMKFVDHSHYQDKYRIQTTRLQCWNYGADGYYFVTICTKNKIKYFGDMVDGEVLLSKIGQITKLYWAEIPNHYSFVVLDEYIIMPNHLHGIIIINKDKDTTRETQNISSLQLNDLNIKQNRFGPQSNNLASIIRGFKAAVKKCATTNHIPFEWQSRFYEHIIRNEEDLNKIREYIVYNPGNWLTDEDFV